MSPLKYIVSSIFLLSAVLLSAQDEKFVASAPANVQAGQQFQYTIQGNRQGNVQLPAMADFDVLAGPFTSFSSSTQWVNGRMKAETTASYTYILRGKSDGSFVIPPAIIKIKKETFETNSVDITVNGSGNSQSSPASNTGNSSATTVSSSANVAEDQPVFLRVLPSKRTMYLGEQFVCELKVYTRVNTRPTAGIKEVPYEGFYKHALDADQNSSREVLNGVEHVTQVLQRHVLIPQKNGKMVIEPFDSEWAVPQQVKQRRTGNPMDDFFNDPFNDPFFNRSREVPQMITTQPVTINVKPLPANAPEGFTGGVGNLKFSAALSADKATVNDAISLKITISGIGNISLIGAPEVDFPPDHDVYETTKSTNISTSGNKVSGSVKFEYPIVVRHAGSFRIAPISFSWFDPVSETYKTATSEEFNFVVEKGDASDEGQVFVSGLRSEEVENIGTDILDINRTVPEFYKIGESPFSSTLYWISYLFLFILFLTLTFLLPKYFRQKADVRLVRNRRANKMARNRLKTADKARKMNDSEKFFEEAEKAIWGYMADKLSIELSSLSRDKIAEVLSSASVSEELQDELLRIMNDCEFSRYAPSSEKTDMNQLYEEAIRLINKLEQNIRVK